ncbi:VOC family protein [Paenibacillus nanensis]|uniref:VOC family protein n=1 Tax=Paenibacillus nanensis TaxID=393251 RepID=A0A3A1UXU1_9BACL|nr:VOC family protein [Paenibacillus nanensis]RIX50140.1 VOC family protein [Paenibacillus nanensis]
MGTLKPYLMSEDARAQAEFYTKALGGEIVSIITHEQAMGAQNDYKHKVMHLCLSVPGGSHIFMADAIEPLQHGTGVYLSLEFQSENEARTAFANLAEGGQVKYPFEFQPFGLFLGELRDKFGVLWMITSEQKPE